MRRGDVVTVRGYRGLRHVQTDALPAGHASVVVCQMTSEGDDAEDFRVAVEPSTRNALRTRAHVMADKPVTIRRARIGRRIGRLEDGDIARLNVALAFVMGLAD
ncbi:MAG: type II toxin-antitoxin system PemK/MazF family toxin [Acidobacteria bacterium]|nr:MAG: type II toxin-antitoxin system PemK/MazF family toxin [Acidobacteriota bacterium]